MKKRAILFVALIAVVICAYAGVTVFDSENSIATAAKKAYSATVYVAGHGGHFAKADITIDPNNAANPLKITNLDRVVTGTSKTHPMHDARIDSEDSNTIFWSTYIPDPQGKMHIGKSDLKTGNVIKDVALTPDAKAPGKKPPLYCASGQSKKFYMPVFMGNESYIDVVDKNTLENKHRVFISDLGYKPGTYKFLHGINSPDMKKFLVAINQAADGKGNGKVDFIMLDLAALESGKIKELAKNTLTGEPDKTLTFRMSFSSDGKYIYQSAADRFWMIDASTLKLVDEKMTPEGGQIHDATPTPDGKYAIMTTRALAPAYDAQGKSISEGKEITDGFLLLYDVDAKKIVGKPVSTCQACHTGMGLGDKTAVLCGIDANWKK